MSAEVEAERGAASGRGASSGGTSPSTRAARRGFVVRELGVLVALVLLVAATAVSRPIFLSPQSIRDLLLDAAVLTILAVGQTLVIVTRNVDLSVGSIVGLVAFVVGDLFVKAGAPIPLAVAVGVGLGTLCGLVNGALIVAARVPALVVTLGTLYIFRGIDHVWASGRQINAWDMPQEFLRWGTAGVLGVPFLAVLAVVVLLVAGAVLHWYRCGRELYAIGSQPEAARLSGIPVGRRVLAVFVADGALAGVAGVLYAARFGTVDATAGTGWELTVIAAAVVGGVAIFGGSGTVFGAALGAVLLTTVETALAVLRIDPFWHQAVVGALILAAIGLDRALGARLAGRLRGRSVHGA